MNHLPFPRTEMAEHATAARMAFKARGSGGSEEERGGGRQGLPSQLAAPDFQPVNEIEYILWALLIRADLFVTI